MHRNILLIIAGLCLATFLGCSGENPTIPFDRLGNIEFISPTQGGTFDPSTVTTAKWQITSLIPISHQTVSLVDEAGEETSLPIGGNLVEDPEEFFTLFWETSAEVGTYHLLVEAFGEGDILITAGNSPEFLIQPPSAVDYDTIQIISPADEAIIYSGGILYILGTVTDNEGNQKPSENLTIAISPNGDDWTNLGQVITGYDGNFIFGWFVPPTLSGSYELKIETGNGSQQISIYILHL